MEEGRRKKNEKWLFEAENASLPVINSLQGKTNSAIGEEILESRNDINPITSTSLITSEKSHSTFPVLEKVGANEKVLLDFGNYSSPVLIDSQGNESSGLSGKVLELDPLELSNGIIPVPSSGLTISEKRFRTRNSNQSEKPAPKVS